VTGAVIFDGRTRLTFTNPIGSGSVVDYVSVRIEGPDLTAGRQVYAGWAEGFLGLGRYFMGLNESWRGWNGEQIFESVESDLRLVAIHDGHIQLTIVLRESTEPRGWRVEAQLRIDAGEQLTNAARDVAELVGR
jgi:hypothetical protein